jgi:predicted transcriptional regulator
MRPVRQRGFCVTYSTVVSGRGAIDVVDSGDIVPLSTTVISRISCPLVIENRNHMKKIVICALQNIIVIPENLVETGFLLTVE